MEKQTFGYVRDMLYFSMNYKNMFPCYLFIRECLNPVILKPWDHDPGLQGWLLEMKLTAGNMPHGQMCYSNYTETNNHGISPNTTGIFPLFVGPPSLEFGSFSVGDCSAIVQEIFWVIKPTLQVLYGSVVIMWIYVYIAHVFSIYLQRIVN